MNAILATANSDSQNVAAEPSTAQSQDTTQYRSGADDAWEQDYLAEVALAEQRERIFSSSYLPQCAGRFFIH
jgi:hypothetical protein